MNVKIKSTGVVCLVTDDYDWIYSNLRKQFGEGTAQIFTERTPGSDYLQWELPGDGWGQLSQAEPLTAAQVRKAWRERQRAVEERFANKEKARRLLAVPDESYVYYKFMTSGQLLVRQVAWGYRYPQRAGSSALSGVYSEKAALQDAIITILDAGRPVASKIFKLNGFDRVTDGDGKLPLGELQPGCEFDVEVDGIIRHITVEEGKGEIIIDATRFATVLTRVTLGGKPYAGGSVLIECGSHQLATALDTRGEASIEVPYEEGLEVTVTVDGHSRRQPLAESTLVELNISEPQVDPPAPPQPPVPAEPPVTTDPPVPTDRPVPPAPPVADVPAQPVPPAAPVGSQEVTAPSGSGSKLMAFLFGLCLALLTLATFWLCGGILLG